MVVFFRGLAESSRAPLAASASQDSGCVTVTRTVQMAATRKAVTPRNRQPSHQPKHQLCLRLCLRLCHQDHLCVSSLGEVSLLPHGEEGEMEEGEGGGEKWKGEEGGEKWKGERERDM